MTPHEYVITQDAGRAPFERSKIDDAVFKAGLATRGCDLIMATILAEEVAEAVTMFLEGNYDDGPPHIEDVYDTIKKVLIGTGHTRIASLLNMDDLKAAAADVCLCQTEAKQMQRVVLVGAATSCRRTSL